MTIKKFQGNTKEEAIALAKEALGDSVVIMSTKDRKPEGIFGMFKKSIVEVTVALEDEPEVIPFVHPTKIMPEKSTFTAVADESIRIDQLEQTPVNDLKSAFKEISEVIEKNPNATVTAVSSADSPIIKQSQITPKEEPKEKPKEEVVEEMPHPSERKPGMNLTFRRMLLQNLLANDIEESYINSLLDDMGNILMNSNSIEYMMSNVYQKMVLKLGKPKTIQLEENKPKFVFLIGPTGVGKTTTIAKLAAHFKITKKKQVAFITTDTYRLKAADQLSEFANIMDIPIEVVLEPKDLNTAANKFADYDLVLVDTIGFSHRNKEQKEAMKDWIDQLDPGYTKEMYLVVSVTTRFRDLKEIADIYKTICNFNLIFTKLDETEVYGNIMNLKLYTGAELSYLTTGQSVPEDIEVVDTQRIVKQFLGGS